MGRTFFFEWEVAFMEWLQLHGGKAGEVLGKIFTSFGEELVLIALLGFLYWSYDKKLGKYIGLNLVVALVWNPLLKNIFIRRRPYLDHPGIRCLKPVHAGADISDIAAQGYSFPSGHSTDAVSVYGSMALYKKKKVYWILAAILILGIGLSRNMLGVHYPTDVLAGWGLGFLSLCVVSFLKKICKNETMLYVVLAASGIPGMFYCRSDDYFTAYGILLGAFAAFWFEENYVNFENTTCLIRAVLRVLGGVALFLVLNSLLKVPFSETFLKNGTFLSHMVRLVRYAIVIFVVLGVYPMIFRFTGRIKGFNRKEC